ncbi:MAG: OmpA family protein [Mucilaginibacter sp.]|nr:OmpA family protein [Mucilaginibacter sp.]
MKFLRICLYTAAVGALAFVLPSCKAKKLAVKSTPVTEVPSNQPATPVTQNAAPAPVTEVPPAPAKPDLNFSNIQFDYNSSVLKTGAIQLLDQAAAQMKKSPSTIFIVNGYASSEGTPGHNMELSVQRANSVKLYLINDGVDANNLTAKGYGESNPIASNSTSDGKELNRRVEIKIQ